MNLNRRQMIMGIGAAIIAGHIPKFVPNLLPESIGNKLISGSDALSINIKNAASLIIENLGNETIYIGNLKGDLMRVGMPIPKYSMLQIDRISNQEIFVSPGNTRVTWIE